MIYFLNYCTILKLLFCQLPKIISFLAPHHRCRNLGGLDMSSCSTDRNPLLDDSACGGADTPCYQLDHACGENKPYVQYCHIPALAPNYTFSQFEYFTADSAYETCSKVGGSVPSLEVEQDALWFVKTIEYISSFVRFGWPFSLRYSTWPVSYVTLQFISHLFL